MIPESVVREMMTGAVVETLVTLGISSGELSYNKARTIYGDDFVKLVKAGRIKPVRVGNGRTGTKYFRVTDIISARATEHCKAYIYE